MATPVCFLGPFALLGIFFLLLYREIMSTLDLKDGVFGCFIYLFIFVVVVCFYVSLYLFTEELRTLMLIMLRGFLHALGQEFFRFNLFFD